MVDSVMAPVNNSNCQEDVDEFLANLAAPRPLQLTSTEPCEPTVSTMQHLPESVRSLLSVANFTPLDVVEELDHQEANVSAYIGGYIIKKLRCVMCEDCVSSLTTNLDAHEPTHEFLMEKNYASATTGLTAPSTWLTDVLQGMEAEYRKVIDVCVSQCGVIRRLECAMTKNVDLSGISCGSCHVDKSIVRLFVTIRLHHTIKENNRSLSLGRKKNRKMLKLSHT